MALSRFKAAAFSLLLLLLVLLAAEALARLVYARAHGVPFEAVRAAVDMQRRGQAEPWRPEPNRVMEKFNEILHPYLGYVQAPGDPAISAYGFFDNKTPLATDPSCFNIAVLGGSFASQFCTLAGDYFAGLAARHHARPVVFNLALGGYKQPQQMLALAYFLSLGARYDLVINLDGFNEVALSSVDNRSLGVNPFYPRLWHRRLANLWDPDAAEVQYQLRRLREQQARWSGGCRRLGFQRSALLSMVWQRRADTLDRRALEMGRQANQRAQDLPIMAAGPPLPESADLFRMAAAQWAASSRLMNDLCRGRGIAYAHFLQPNQYVEGAKPLSETERATVYDENHPYRPAVLQGYPRLREEGVRLAGELAFCDLSEVFAGVAEDIYSDSCCHLNAAGYRRIADAMARAMGWP